jgi:hypothetical protein
MREGDLQGVYPVAQVLQMKRLQSLAAFQSSQSPHVVLRCQPVTRLSIRDKVDVWMVISPPQIPQLDKFFSNAREVDPSNYILDVNFCSLSLDIDSTQSTC